MTDAGSQLTWEGGRAGISKNVTDTKRDRRGVTTDLGGGQGRNKQKRDQRGVTNDLGGGKGRNKQKRDQRGVTTDLLDVEILSAQQCLVIDANLQLS